MQLSDAYLKNSKNALGWQPHLPGNPFEMRDANPTT
jgi:hypothetical protein